ncbi:MAG: hypothetical protein QM426_05685 [Euryarchaeota archaeon]|nr:hypothetical protein [Euryarchaeota archaeon]
MSKNSFLRATSLFMGILLCLASISAVFAQIEDVEGSSSGRSNNSVNKKLIIHEINPSYNDLYLQQGENASFTVSFKNNGKKALDIEPKVAAVPYNDRDFDESWISISPANVTVDRGAEQEFTIEVSIPEDVVGGYYDTYITFTDDVYSEGDPYPQYVNAMYLSISVPIYPKLELQTSFIDDTIEAGKEYEYTVKIKNVASKNITIDPEVNRYSYPFDEFGLDDDEIEITAPSTLEPGQIADMVIRVPVPDNARGTYNGYIEMSINGNENEGYGPRLELYLNVLQQPTVPYVKTFSTRSADPIRIEVSAYGSGSNAWLRSPQKDEVPSFELNVKYNSSPVNMILVKTKQSSNVNIERDYFSSFSIEEGGIYQNCGSYYTETYTVPGAIGDWELEILPKNIGSFDYSIIIGDSE